MPSVGLWFCYWYADESSIKLISPPGYWEMQSNSEKSSFTVMLIYEKGGRETPLAEISYWLGV